LVFAKCTHTRWWVKKEEKPKRNGQQQNPPAPPTKNPTSTRWRGVPRPHTKRVSKREPLIKPPDPPPDIHPVTNGFWSKPKTRPKKGTPHQLGNPPRHRMLKTYWCVGHGVTGQHHFLNPPPPGAPPVLSPGDNVTPKGKPRRWGEAEKRKPPHKQFKTKTPQTEVEMKTKRQRGARVLVCLFSNGPARKKGSGGGCGKTKST